MADYTTKDAVSYALSGNSGEFKKAIHDILNDKINDAVELKKFDVASTFMSTKEDDVDTLPSEVEPEVEPAVEPEESENETTEV
tara:strand:- start:453 stop:704 length:252 start_codon:yes stop_codon:yes gene_type:complete